MELAPEASELLAGLPGEEFVTRGLEDLLRGDFDSIEALVVQMGALRMMPCGFSFLAPLVSPARPDLELSLYQRISERGDDDVYGRYNSLRSRLSSFLSALEGRCRRDFPE